MAAPPVSVCLGESLCNADLGDDFAASEASIAASIPLACPMPGYESQEANELGIADHSERRGNLDDVIVSTSTVDDGSTACAARASVGSGTFDGGALELASGIDASRTRSSAQMAAAEVPLPPLTAHSLKLRDSAIFVVGKSSPIPSQLERAATLPTGELVLLAWKLTTDWPKARIEELAASFGNFDRVVGLGWLLADALGLPVLDRNEGPHSALAVGKAAISRAKKIDDAITSAKRAISKHPVDSAKRKDPPNASMY